MAVLGVTVGGVNPRIGDMWRYLALKMLSRRYKLTPGKIKSDVSVKKGGQQIEYEDENPDIRRIFEESCAKAGATMMMPPR